MIKTSQDKYQLDGARNILFDLENPERLEEIINEIEQGLNDKSDKAIDGAKCLIETICKIILTEKGQEISRNKKLNQLVEDTLKVIGISIDYGNDKIRDIFSGTSTVINAIACLRNDHGLLSHGHDIDCSMLDDWQRFSIVQTSEMISILMYERYKRLPTDLKYTRKPYDNSDKKNKEIDENCSIQVKDSENQISINSIDFRPSQILYTLDRNAYIEAINELTSYTEKNSQGIEN